MRLFIALSVETSYLNELKKELSDVRGRFINDENFHLTLSFLGEIKEDKIDEIKQIIKSIPFELKYLRSLEVDTFREDTVVLKFENNKYLLNYQKELTKELDKHHISNDKKPYKPHITIIRHSDEIITGEYKRVFKLTGIHLFSSLLTPQGSIYKSLYKKSV